MQRCLSEPPAALSVPFELVNVNVGSGMLHLLIITW